MSPPVWFKTLDHLASVPGNGYTDLTAPRGCNQDGIAAALGITRAHVALNLKNLVNRELVMVRLLHVPGKNRKVRTYQLTFYGYKFLHELHTRRGQEV
ncbi:MAG: hypothetical protein V1934_00370 [Methanobacteriota archaeon]